jgi:hypothetical protein
MIDCDNSMLYPEFGQYKSFVDPLNPLCNAYRAPNGHIFYVEPGFYDLMKGLDDKRHDRFPEALARIYQIIEQNPKVIFTGNFESPFMQKEGFMYVELEDITNPLQIYFEDKCRGSDYGD